MGLYTWWHLCVGAIGSIPCDGNYMKIRQSQSPTKAPVLWMLSPTLTYINQEWGHWKDPGLLQFRICVRNASLIARFMRPTWGRFAGRQDPGGPHVGPMSFAIWDLIPYGTCYLAHNATRQCVQTYLHDSRGPHECWPWTEMSQISSILLYIYNFIVWIMRHEICLMMNEEVLESFVSCL